ncbi:hypothetical protein DdX_20048 [Ditylenchus destructor]|uniref:Uncharacterized protein n=1 Tax=Ditylenchus destructor TaxID=166010 RepID=A0AAD4QWL1_9BILA|nr:hypothetical protein DdX_20048 [Ditylenchus destructor]
MGKKHVCCTQLWIDGKADLNLDDAFLDFLLTGAHCTPSIKIGYRDLSKAMLDLVPPATMALDHGTPPYHTEDVTLPLKFMELKTTDENQLIETIEGAFNNPAIELFKHDYAEFFVKEERSRRKTSGPAGSPTNAASVSQTKKTEDHLEGTYYKIIGLETGIIRLSWPRASDSCITRQNPSTDGGSVTWPNPGFSGFPEAISFGGHRTRA